MVDEDGSRAVDAPQSAWLRRVFFCTGGLRLGWRIALYWVMFGVIAAVENWWADSLQLGKLWSQMFGELIGAGESTIFKRIAEGKLRAVKDGRKMTLILRADAEAYLESLPTVKPRL